MENLYNECFKTTFINLTEYKMFNFIPVNILATVDTGSVRIKNEGNRFINLDTMEEVDNSKSFYDVFIDKCYKEAYPVDIDKASSRNMLINKNIIVYDMSKVCANVYYNSLSLDIFYVEINKNNIGINITK